MKILVINAGSSSLKYQLFNMSDEKMLAKGICERIGNRGRLTHKTPDGKSVSFDVDMPSHVEAFKQVQKVLSTGENPVIKDLGEIAAVGHRMLHGASKFNKSMLITRELIEELDELSMFAPLHNPANIMGIRSCRDVLGPDVPQVVVFDTEFHSTMPPEAYMYPIPYEYYEKYQLRRYGFHGTSHKYVSHKCAELMGRDIKDLKIITVHCGNGSSITAVKNGKSVDTSMGLTPLEGIIMGTRSGSVDPTVVSFLCDKEKMSPIEVCQLLNKKSGKLGLSGVSSDDRDLREAEKNGNERAALALRIQNYQVIKYIGAYAAVMNGVDAIAFAGGIGENSEPMRKEVCNSLSYLGVKLDYELNNKTLYGVQGEISAADSKVKVFVIPTNEELVIARETLAIVEKLN